MKDRPQGESVVDQNGDIILRDCSYFWWCLVGSLGAANNRTSFKKECSSASKVTKHLPTVHSITSGKSKSAECSLYHMETWLDASTSCFKTGSPRFFQAMLGTLGAHHAVLWKLSDQIFGMSFQRISLLLIVGIVCRTLVFLAFR